MATPSIKSTYSLDVETVRQLEAMARRWNVSKSEALRRMIRAAAAQQPPEGQEALEALHALQDTLGLTGEAAECWEDGLQAQRRGAASQALTWRDPSKHRILIRALVAGSPEDRVLQAWIRNGETLGIGAIGWTEFLCGPLEESHLELAARVITSEDPLPRIALWWPHNCSTNPDVDGDLSSIACSPPRLCKRVLLWQLPTRPTSADSKLPDLPSRLSTSKN